MQEVTNLNIYNNCKTVEKYVNMIHFYVISVQLWRPRMAPTHRCIQKKRNGET